MDTASASGLITCALVASLAASVGFVVVRGAHSSAVPRLLALSLPAAAAGLLVPTWLVAVAPNSWWMAAAAVGLTAAMVAVAGGATLALRLVHAAPAPLRATGRRAGVAHPGRRVGGGQAARQRVPR